MQVNISLSFDCSVSSNTFNVSSTTPSNTSEKELSLQTTPKDRCFCKKKPSISNDIFFSSESIPKVSESEEFKKNLSPHSAKEYYDYILTIIKAKRVLEGKVQYGVKIKTELYHLNLKKQFEIKEIISYFEKLKVIVENCKNIKSASISKDEFFASLKNKRNNNFNCSSRAFQEKKNERSKYFKKLCLQLKRVTK